MRGAGEDLAQEERCVQRAGLWKELRRQVGRSWKSVQAAVAGGCEHGVRMDLEGMERGRASPRSGFWIFLTVQWEATGRKARHAFKLPWTIV